jgi:hypothetical protein
MIILILEQTGEQTVLQPGDVISYRRSDGLIRFSRGGKHLAIHAGKTDEGLSYFPLLGWKRAFDTALLIAKIAGLHVKDTEEAHGPYYFNFELQK